MRQWSTYQQDIFDFVSYGEGNAIVEAVAGSGKTTTIVEAIGRLHQAAHTVFLAFNKSIAEELKARGVNARTFHSLTYGPVTQFKGVRTVETNKLRTLVAQHFKGDDAMLYGAFAQRLVGLARQVGIGCLVDDIESEWYDLVDHHDIELSNEMADLHRGIELSRHLLALSNASNLVDFDDLLYIAVKEGVSLPKFDFVFVDEAQDTNAIQRALLRKIMRPKARLVAVGDPAQAIYGFRGADSDSMRLLAEEFDCTTLPLTVTYRCPTSVVEYARQWVDHIQAAPNALEGHVDELGTHWTLDMFGANDLVVCRTTAPVIKLGYAMLKAGKPVRIMGREIGQGLKSLITKLNPRNLDDLRGRLDRWCVRECEKAIAKQQDEKLQSIEDKAGAIQCLIEGLGEDATVATLIELIDTLFSSTVDATVLSTIHKAKGLEADTVFWLNRSECPSKWARQSWQKQQEANLCYVAATRAVRQLITIEA